MSHLPPNSPGPTWTPGSVVLGTRYEVKRLLGSGGMGTVYEVQHLDEGKRYALKVLSSRVAEHPDLVERVLLEADALRGLRGAPYIVEVITSGRLSDRHRRPYLVMELLQGATLRTLLGHGPLPMADALSYVHQLLWGLAGVHGAGVVHRDVKPDNVFVQNNGECKLLDFGVIKVLYDIGLSPSQFSTGEHALIGTPMYMAPEAASCRPVDTRADIFAVGLILYECLTGSRPLAQLTDRAYLHHVANQGIPSLDAVGATHIPIELRRIVRRATIFDPDNRYQTAQEFAVKLNRAAETLGIRLREAPPNAHAPGAVAATARRPLATTLSASTPTGNPFASTKRAPRSLAERGGPAHGVGASPPGALASPAADVDAPAALGLGTPPPTNEPPSTRPRSRTRRRLSLLTLASPGHDGAAPQGVEQRGARRRHAMAPPAPAASSRAGAWPSSLPFSSLVRSVLPRLEDAIARMAGMLTPVRQAREAAAPASAAPPRAERPAHNDAAPSSQRPVSSASRRGQSGAPPTPSARVRQLTWLVAMFGLASAFLVALRWKTSHQRATLANVSHLASIETERSRTPGEKAAPKAASASASSGQHVASESTPAVAPSSAGSPPAKKVGRPKSRDAAESAPATKPGETPRTAPAGSDLYDIGQRRVGPPR